MLSVLSRTRQYLTLVQRSLYNRYMKRRDLEKKLSQLGWYFRNHGGNHDTWTNGKELEQIPRHKEISELLAKKILRTAMRYQGDRKKG